MSVRSTVSSVYISFARAGVTTLEFDPAFTETIEHLNAWRRVPHAL